MFVAHRISKRLRECVSIKVQCGIAFGALYHNRFTTVLLMI